VLVAQQILVQLAARNIGQLTDIELPPRRAGPYRATVRASHQTADPGALSSALDRHRADRTGSQAAMAVLRAITRRSQVYRPRPMISFMIAVVPPKSC
jgi:hypothetical protein